MPSRQPSDPRIWLVVGEKPGDNAQVRAIANALELPCEWKILRCKPAYQEGKPQIRPSLSHLDLERSDPLTPPWPDLILTIGRRPMSAALWIKRQSGGRSRIVVVGRPKGGWAPYDLIITAAHYPLPPDPRVLELKFPLIFPDRERIEAARTAWADHLAGLPRPLVPVLIGGRTRPYRFGRTEAEILIERSRRLAGRGTAFLCTSRRTKAPVREAVRASGLPYYDWHEGGDNPYFGLLAHGDAFVVTGDSISMMMEVARLGKPLAIFPLPVQQSWRHTWARMLGRELLYHPPPGSIRARLGQLLFGLGLIGYERRLENIHQHLYHSGAALPLGQGDILSLSPPSLEDELPKVTRRIRALLDM
ncbi:conserved hypothetical protein [Methylomarinovum tepidoasis]|uniref:Nucleoside-diphosphate sugar epimerase n=1 Tax=Methylomarinovum tepidoasis TaxID=2840183 RepID=A0AAU9CAL8_9GAMM|nr:ELM1/GtrOC1 family putative glycosyltransferase [Methylomarinovum sp. IN45]BCX88961.1 conserved hypothetical protein [Methylomarinovum sp. IN45]